MNQDKDETARMMGKILLDKGEYGRDAIHLAVVPVIAAHALYPGQHVGLIDDDKAGEVESPVGVVDPFLKVSVKTGEKFWLCLYPGSVTSLRHVWTHPAFAFSGEKDTPPKAVEQPDKKASEKWLREYAKRVSPYDAEQSEDKAYHNLMAGIAEGRIFYHGSDLHGFDELEEPDELKHHAQIVLDKVISYDTFEFSCSC